MKILLVSIGTRGDMEPFLAIGQMLKQKGHEVVAVFPGQFEGLALDAGLEFRSLGNEFLDLLESKEGKLALGGGGSLWKKIPAFFRLTLKYTRINKQLIMRQYETVKAEGPDRILRHAKAVYPVLWELENPEKTVLISPVPYIVHTVKDRAHIAFSGNYGKVINKLTYWIALGGLIQTIKKSAKWIHKQYNTQEVRSAVLATKTIYTISPQLFSRPDYWPAYVKVLGYQERKGNVNGNIDKDLEAFIAIHEKLLFVTFGSMTNPDSEGKTKVLMEVIHHLKIPTVINIAAGGLLNPEQYDPDLVCFITQVPYDYILPKMYAMIHHGGSGTTHLSLKHGCASMIVPHIIDQYMWNEILNNVGVGPKGMEIGKFKTKYLLPKLKDLWENEAYKSKAKEIAIKMEQENFGEEICRFILSD
ncbi:glycosyltransferase [Echinicola sp. CAU 1574]|uniref:Glycosyltransferase n=1 Tax=Echinicola arenosa TaxID=2774144 RepID=A0ABR9AJP6_9BACT|nr:nucleotide disphospho-sugar-binding domain-containing protein [Echinicola arenosa]MBD8488935.1 glycosyltransferase [Echinicola arenosa]